MTTYEAMSLIAQFGMTQIAILTLIVTIVVYLNKRSNRPRLRSAITSVDLLISTFGQPLFMRSVVAGVRVVDAIRIPYSKYIILFIFYTVIIFYLIIYCVTRFLIKYLPYYLLLMTK